MNEIIEMHEMVYKDFTVSYGKPSEIIGHGLYHGYEWYILSMHTHPCAYIVLERNNKVLSYGDSCEALDEVINCHGGVTYSDDYLGQNGMFVNKDKYLWVIGWDYHHWDDYSGTFNNLESISGDVDAYGHRWTTEEIYDEIKDVIKQIMGVNI